MKRPVSIFALLLVLAFPVTAGVVINEVQSSNDATPVVDDRGEPMDWIELYNGGAEPVSLAGWGLSDKGTKDPFKFKFPAGASIPAGGYLVVLADTCELATSKTRYVARISLGASGETLTLSDASANTVDEITFGTVPCDCSFGRVGDGGEELKWFATPTPGTANTAKPYEKPLEPVAFTPGRGVFTGSTVLSVELTHPESGVTIRYTLDHSEPTAEHGIVYDGTPIPVSGTTVIRATAVKEGHLAYRNVETHSYIFLDQVADQTKASDVCADTWADEGSTPASYTVSKNVLTNAQARADFVAALRKAPIVSITMSDPDFFDKDNGLYVKPTTLTDVNRQADIEWVSVDKPFGQGCAIEMHGGYSRRFDMQPKKPMKVKFKAPFGPSSLKQPVMKDAGSDVKEFKKLVLRGEHNYHWTQIKTSSGSTPKAEAGTYMHDQFFRDAQELMSGYRVKGTHVHLFLNGMYWGLYNLTDHISDAYAATTWSDGDLDMRDYYDVISDDEVRDGTNTGWKAVQALVNKGMDTKAQYDAITNGFDLVGYIDYLLVQWFVANEDWPGNNWVVAGSSKLGVPYRYLLWDVEKSLQVGDKSFLNESTGAMAFHAKLRGNAEYKLLFADRIHKHFYNDGALAPQALEERYGKMATEVRPRLFAEAARWGSYQADFNVGTKKRYGLADWDKELALLTGTWFPTRRTTLLNQLQTAGFYPSLAAAEFEVAADRKSATLKSAPSGATVYYTTDGSDPRVAYENVKSASAEVCAVGAKIEATGSEPVKARVLSGSTWSALTELALASPCNTFVPTGNGENWDVDANWTYGYFPNATNAEASVGVPTTLKKNATYRNIHIDSHDISVAQLDFTNGGKTNRVDTGDNGGGDFNLYGTVTVKDAGAAMIDLDEPSVIRLCTNVTADVAEGGELILKGALAGNGFNLLKTGPGTLTLACTNAAGTTFKLQCEAGVVAVEKPIAVSEVTKSGSLWVKIGETASETNVILTSDGKCNPTVRLFVPATEVGQVWVGGVMAASFKIGAQVYIPDAFGTASFDGQNWSPAADAPVKQVTVDGKLTFEVTVNSLEPVNNGCLRLSEICPDPQISFTPEKVTTDSPRNRDAPDPNGAYAGWIELVNAGTDPVNLAQYELQVVNRGKKASAGKYPNLPAKTLQPGERVLVYTTKDYCEGGRFSTALMEEDSVRAFTAGEAAGITADEIVLSTRVNPKKFPMVRLLRGDEVIDSVIVPCDLPDNTSVIVLDPEEGGATRRFMTAKPTKGAENDLTDAVALGPNVGPLYGIKHAYSDLDPIAPATAGQDYAITLDVNPVDPANAGDEIVSVTLVYRTDVNVTSEASFKTLVMAKGENDTKGHGQMWTAAVPAANLPAKGMLLQWRAKITDAAGNTWTSPAFLDKDNGYGWYGTIVDPGVGDSDGQNSATLPTLHLFAEEGNATYPLTDLPGKSSTLGDGCLMNRDYDETYAYPTGKDSSTKQNYRKYYPYGARIAIYDAQTSNYYDNVRIDCRGNSSDDYYKRSHGLKFPKTKAYLLAEPFTAAGGVEVESVRKTSLHGEYNDPSYFRQRMSFWFLNQAGSPAPYEHPKRVNLNGEFYQFAYETPRFSDDLIEDLYGLDPRGRSYKNIGSFHKWSTDDFGYQMGTSATAGTKKVTPDDKDEKDFTELTAFFGEIAAAGNVKDSAQYPNDTTGLDNAQLTANVVRKFDLPAWINYLAATKITQEGDDAWGNVSGYYDSWQNLDGAMGGTGTWRPLGWDMNCAWGQYYQCHVSVSRNGIMADQDWNKCHPLYGGVRIWGYKSSSASSSNSYYGKNGANYAFEAVFQSTKFRRLFLRRLRTLMDKYLKAQNTVEDDTPIAVQAKAYAEEIQAEAVKDRKLWGNLGTTSGNKDCDWVNCWGTTMMSNKGIQPDNPTYGYQDIWDNYIVPRRVHLYTTHSIDNTTKGVGYALAKSAGIPHAQSAFLDLRDQITIRADGATGSVVIENMNAETVDISGWKVSGPVEMTLPPGTVVDQADGQTPGQVFVTADRRATIEAMTLTDQVVVGNGEAGDASAKPRLLSDAGEPVYPLTVDVTVTTSGKGEGTVTGAGEYDFGATVTLTATPATGSHFTKWTFADGTETNENPFVLKDLQGAVTVDAKFKVNSYSVKYDPNGGEGEIEPGEGDYGSKYETAECTFTKAGKVCAGWGTNGVDGLVFVCEPGKKVTNLAIEDGAEVTLYAMWEPKMPSPDDPAEITTNLTLSVGETVVFTNRYRKNLRFWLLGSDGAGECVETALNLPTNACEQYRGYVARSTFKTNEVIVTITGKVKGEESVFLGRQYKSKEPRCAARYDVLVSDIEPKK